MATRQRVVSEGDLPEFQDESDNPETEAINSLLASLGEGIDAKVTVYRIVPNKPKGYLFACSPGEFSIDKLRDDFGGGTFRVFISGKNPDTGKVSMISSPTLYVEPPIKRQESVTQQPQGNLDMVGMMREIASQLAAQQMASQLKMMELIMGQRNNAPAIDPMQMQQQFLQQLVTMKSLFSDGDTKSDPMEGIIKGIELAKTMTPREGETGTMDVLLEAVKSFGPTIGKVLEQKQAMNTQQMPVAGQPLIHAPVSYAPQPVPQPTGGQDVNLILRAQLAMLVNKAKNGSDPALYADLILDNIDETEIKNFLLDSGAMDKLVALNPEVGTVRPWFESLANEVRSALTNDGLSAHDSEHDLDADNNDG